VSSNTDLEVEATGETVGEAKWQALRELERKRPGLDRSQVRFQVLSEGERGLLGVGYAPARVIAMVALVEPAPPEPAAPASDEGAAARLVREVLERIVQALGLRCAITVSEGDDSVTASCSGPDVAFFIGRHGQTIDAAQYLANAILARAHPEGRKVVTVDAGGYRDRRRTILESLAERSAERALASGEDVELQPMTAVERKIVHTALAENAAVETLSEGTEPNRFVVIKPSTQRPGRESGPAEEVSEEPGGSSGEQLTE
jgi:spoIIIJ-associated protein